MSIRKYITSAMLALSVMCAAMPARAGIPVIDAAALTQQIQQVVSWVQQFQQMQDQFTKLQQQFQQMQTMTTKLDGARSLGSILNDPAIKAALPPEMRDAASMLLNPSALGTSQANIDSIMASFGITGTSQLASATGVADAMGKSQAILTSTQQRQAQLQALAGRVDGAADAKESMDLLNRNTLEVASINNQLIQTIASSDAAKRAQELREAAELQDFASKFKVGASAPIRAIR
jgi:type IV secretion system protein VirB5